MTLYTLDDLYTHMPWNEISAVVFDVGNVLLTFDPKTILEETVPEVPELYPRLMRRVFRSPYWLTQDHGTATKEETTQRMIGRETDLAPYIRRIIDGWVDMKHVIPEGVEALRACAAHGKRTFVLSNYGSEAFELVRQRYSFFELFEGFIVSSRIRMMKPELDIYRYAEQTYGLTADQTLFIDDTAVNIYGAMCAGWQGIVYDEPGKLARFFGD